MPQISETVEPPPGPMLRSVRQCMLFVKIHEQRCHAERVEPDVRQLFLVRELRHVRAPAFSPISDGRYVHAVEKWIPVVSLPCFRNQFTPIFKKHVVRSGATLESA